MQLLVPLSLDTRYDFGLIVEKINNLQADHLLCMQPDVVELRQQMTPNMTAIQIAVLDIMKACVTELKRCNSSVRFHSISVCMHLLAFCQS
jgi:hypothetical protein